MGALLLYVEFENSEELNEEFDVKILNNNNKKKTR